MKQEPRGFKISRFMSYYHPHMIRICCAPSLSNLDIIKKYLNQLGYTVRVHHLKSDNFGLPQRHIFGLRKSKSSADFEGRTLALLAQCLLAFQDKKLMPVAA